MFDALGERLQSAVSKIKGYGKISEENIEQATREIRLALLEADVNYQVVKEFVAKVKEKAMGEEVATSIKPGDMFVKIVQDELTTLLGGEAKSLNLVGNPAKAMLVGLQGSGKTTAIGKIALHLRKVHSKKPLMVACDIYRPAAIDQLKQIAKQLDIPVYEEGQEDPRQIVTNALAYAKENNHDYVLIDTAGRLHIDEELMDELKDIAAIVKPEETLLVIDAMMGQDAINVIKGFDESLSLSGVILSKMDGDTRGGVALSARYLTNVPIKFIGTSEKMDGLESFDPKRMSGRILGMGDIVSLVEKASEAIDEKEAEKLAKKMQSGKFDLEDFLKQMKSIKKMGPLENLIKLMPGASKMGLDKITIDPKQIAHVEAIILSMTPQERRNPDIIKASRKTRIAKGCGLSVQEVNKLLTQFENTKKIMKQMQSGNMKFPF